MSDNVRVPNGDRSAKDTAILLLAAAEENDQDPSVVQVSSLGGFTVPEEIAKAAGVEYEDPNEADGSKYNEAEIKEASETPILEPTKVNEEAAEKAEAKPAKKTAAKKSTSTKGK